MPDLTASVQHGLSQLPALPKDSHQLQDPVLVMPAIGHGLTQSYQPSPHIEVPSHNTISLVLQMCPGGGGGTVVGGRTEVAVLGVEVVIDVVVIIVVVGTVVVVGIVVVVGTVVVVDIVVVVSIVVVVGIVVTQPSTQAVSQANFSGSQIPTVTAVLHARPTAADAKMFRLPARTAAKTTVQEPKVIVLHVFSLALQHNPQAAPHAQTLDCRLDTENFALPYLHLALRENRLKRRRSLLSLLTFLLSTFALRVRPELAGKLSQPLIFLTCASVTCAMPLTVSARFSAPHTAFSALDLRLSASHRPNTPRTTTATSITAHTFDIVIANWLFETCPPLEKVGQRGDYGGMLIHIPFLKGPSSTGSNTERLA